MFWFDETKTFLIKCSSFICTLGYMGNQLQLTVVLKIIQLNDGCRSIEQLLLIVTGHKTRQIKGGVSSH